MATIAITGATGYIGRHLVQRLVARGERPRCLVRAGAKTDALPAGKVDVVAADVTDAAALPAALAGADAVVHLASVVANVKQTAKVNYARINDTGTANLVKAAKDAGVGHFLYLSGIGTVPGAEGSYIRTRYNAEGHVKTGGMPYSILEPSILFGDGSAFFVALAGLAKLAPIVPVPGNGKLRFQPVWVEDVVTCIVALLDEGGKDETLQLGGPEYYTYDQLLDQVFKAIKKSRPKLHLPMPLMELGAVAMQILPTPPVTPATLELFGDDNITSLDAIPRRFGFAPKSLATDMAEHGI